MSNLLLLIRADDAAGAGAGLPGNMSRGASFKTCEQVSAMCPIELTTLGYYPNVGINYFFAIMFGIAGVVTLAVGVWKKTWSYMAFLTAGCMLELAGYGARIPLNDNPWNKNAFQTQIVAIILAPTLICVSVYLTLKHVCLALNPALSRVRPALYPNVFVPLDVSCLLLQAIGGALAASAGQTDPELLQHGNRVIIAGIVLQVVVLLFFGATSLDYYLRVKRWIAAGSAAEDSDADPGALELWVNRRFRVFVGAVAASYAMILLRCIYRIAEMAGGWGNHIMQDEISFIILDGFMVLIPCLLLAFLPAGVLFPQMAMAMATKRTKNAGKQQTKGYEQKSQGGSSDHDPEHGISTPASDGARDGEEISTEPKL